MQRLDRAHHQWADAKTARRSVVMEDGAQAVHCGGTISTVAVRSAGVGVALPTSRDLRILIVEDEAIQAAHVASVLRMLGYSSVECAYNGQAAIDAVNAGRVDLVLMDVQMPGKDGVAAAREISAAHGSRVGIVLLTAYSDLGTVQRAREAGVIGYLVKPITSQQLAPALEIAAARCVDLRRARWRAEELERRLEERKVTERAKWVLVQRHGIGEQEAWTLLQKASRATRCKLADMARRVVEGQALPGAPSVVRRLERAGAAPSKSGSGAPDMHSRRSGRFFSARDGGPGLSA